LHYWRLHGAPQTYYSDYEEHWLQTFAERLGSHQDHQTWVIFDNTALGHATANAIWLCDRLRQIAPQHPASA
jgi:uncharacterized protein YecE (DUF72 family)